MNTVLFILFPVSSHYNACFGFADSLRRRGHQVIFAGTPDVQAHVEEQSFDFVQLQYMYEYRIANGRAAVGVFITSRLNKQYIRTRYREFLQATIAVQQICKDTKPTTIYLDEHLNHYYPLLTAEGFVVILVNTKLPTRRVNGIPPLTCKVVVKSTIIDHAYSWVTWKAYLFNRHSTKWINDILFNGNTDDRWLTRLCRRQNIVVNNQSDNAFYDGITEAPTLNLVPRQVEYPWYVPQRNEQFAYYPYERNSLDGAADFWRSMVTVLQRRTNGQIKLIYVSLGTLSNIWAHLAILFLHRLIRVADTLSGVHLLISAGKLKSVFPSTLPENVSIFDWVPQQQILKQCDLMITHGGMNSVCECLMAGVPMLIYPLNVQVDQPGNAARVVANGWGLQGNIRKDNGRQIAKAINRMLFDASYQYRITETRAILVEQLQVVEQSSIHTDGFVRIT